jgi:5-methylthioadenosine/S-adenosylhomocysteine deaminase
LEDVPFFPWIRALNASKANFTGDDWKTSAQLGALESIAGGVTSIGDNTDAGVTMAVASETGLRAVIFQEIFGIDHRDDVSAQIAALDAKLAAHKALASDRVRVGVSPHAPYTIRPALFAALAKYVSDNDLPTSIHVAESVAESELTEAGQGPFANMFSARGIAWEVPFCSPTKFCADNGALTPTSLAVHCVQQSDADIDLVCQTGAAIVHCPKSNAKLGAGIAPLTRWLAKDGLRVALGTDSAVSNNTLDMFEEMRFALLAQRGQLKDAVAVIARRVVEIATLGGAAALGVNAGALAPGKCADMIAVSLDAAHNVPTTDPYSALVYSCRADDVRMTMVEGKVIYRDGKFETLSESAIRTAAIAVRAKAARAAI